MKKQIMILFTVGMMLFVHDSVAQQTSQAIMLITARVAPVVEVQSPGPVTVNLRNSDNNEVVGVFKLQDCRATKPIINVPEGLNVWKGQQEKMTIGIQNRRVENGVNESIELRLNQPDILTKSLAGNYDGYYQIQVAYN